jgi:hypothetical protein
MNQDRPIGRTNISRRRRLHTLSVAAAGVTLTGRLPTHAMQSGRATETLPLVPLNRFPRMVQEFFVERENEIHQQRLKRLAELTTRADAEAYVQTVREKIRDCFGPFPEKTPLNPRVMKVVEREAYRIENVLFESYGPRLHPPPSTLYCTTSRGSSRAPAVWRVTRLALSRLQLRQQVQNFAVPHEPRSGEDRRRTDTRRVIRHSTELATACSTMMVSSSVGSIPPRKPRRADAS